MVAPDPMEERVLGYVLGRPGEAVRTYCEETVALLPHWLREGEVAVRLDRADLRPGTISADGSSFIPDDTALEELRSARWSEAKDIRFMRMTGGCLVPGVGVVDTRNDPVSNSQLFVAGAALSATRAQMTGEPWSKEWTLADNSVVTLDAAQMIAIGDAVEAHLQACQDAGTAIRALIDAAEDEAALAAIDITAGYPPLP
ncbi:hypothetical protein Swit_2175 [Rhizorhabdus wittichii RW1]|uniref:DUF4376 domain-containing protein n=1 Tax=Rhizorhabdus wittichii (strain DSM 6014 / CCUG 31198 / JCM 15750 / NBRC 105917 / EY 4224 / RW1) TaxID=392499 RepID=A0A9J9HBU9_RHIWR|nr:hypothetical protein Swit_2175 [Rhizorhabdus wittichii RW1]